jgi:methylmalonyl-CoA mutase N-terminal domain/subunit
MVESLTRDIMEAAKQYIEKIDSFGGALKAVERGFQQLEIQESSYRYQKEVEADDRVIVGVNKFITPYSRIKHILRINPADEKKQLTGLKRVMKERDTKEVGASLENLKRTAQSSENTMQSFIRCVEAYATMQEICDTLRGVFGVQRESLIF